MTALKAAHRMKRQADSLGTVAFVLLWHGNTRDVGFNGANGRSGANGRDGQGWGGRWRRQVCHRGARREGLGRRGHRQGKRMKFLKITTILTKLPKLLTGVSALD